MWLDIADLRALGGAAAGDDGFVTSFDAIIEYATSKGWLNDAGTHVRAHVA